MSNPLPVSSSRSWWRTADETGIPLLLTRLILGITFIVMGASKVQDPVKFLKDIREFHMVPEGMPLVMNLMAVILPWVEIACGVFLLAGLMLSGAGLLLLAMLVMFTSVIFLRAMNIWTTEHTPFFQIKFDCGCGGGPTIIWIKLLKNLGLTLLAVIVLLSRSRKFCLSLPGARKSFAPAMGPGLQTES